MKFLISLSLTLLIFGNAWAGTGQGAVAKIEAGPLYGSLVMITLNGDVGGQPACRLANNYHFVFNSGTPGGKETLALLMMAKASNLKVVVSGNSVCSLYGGVEDLRWLRLE